VHSIETKNYGKLKNKSD